MNNDKELLELAAKAAGIDGEWVTDYAGGYYYQGNIDGICYELPQGGWHVWNPLTDDGDALRLAVKLGLVVEIGYAARGFLVVRTNTDNWKEFRESWGNAPYAATRRAIVRAAAEIGKELK